jgi:hypothetical protein
VDYVGRGGRGCGAVGLEEGGDGGAGLADVGGLEEALCVSGFG